MDIQMLEDLFKDKFNLKLPIVESLLKLLIKKPINIYHLTKIAGERELTAIFDLSEITIHDHLKVDPFVENHKGPFTAEHIPYLFIYADTEEMKQKAYDFIYGKELTELTA